VEDPTIALGAWCAHNQAILDFYLSHRDRCILGHIHTMASDLVGTVALCARRLGHELRCESASAVYEPAELAQGTFTHDVLAELARIAPAVSVLYERLEQAADRPAGRSPGPLESRAGAAAPAARRGEDTLRRELELLLARVAPRVFVTGKESLDALRRKAL